jgi:hypothetical protein
MTGFETGVRLAGVAGGADGEGALLTAPLNAKAALVYTSLTCSPGKTSAKASTIF